MNIPGELQKDRLRLRFIGCEVLLRAVCRSIALSRHIIDPVFTEKSAHNDSGKMAERIQGLIDEAEEDGRYDGILLGYGLCGNGVLGLRSKTLPLIIPRCHDCCTLFLGSRERFLEHFGERLSAEWSSPGYIERGSDGFHDAHSMGVLGGNQEYQDLVDQYGEENAAYVWETLHPPKKQDAAFFISDPDMDSSPYLEQARAEAEEDGLSLVVIEGDNRLIHHLISGGWNDEYLILRPGERIQGVYDQEEIIRGAGASPA